MVELETLDFAVVFLELPVGVRLSAPEVPDLDSVPGADREQAARRTEPYDFDLFERVFFEELQRVPENVEQLDLVFEGDDDVDARGVERDADRLLAEETFDDGLAAHFVGDLGVDAHHFVVGRDRDLFFEEADVDVEYASLRVFGDHLVPLEVVAVAVLGLQEHVHQLVGVGAEHEVRLALAGVARARDFDDRADGLLLRVADVLALEHFERRLLVLRCRVYDQQSASSATCNQFFVVLEHSVDYGPLHRLFIFFWLLELYLRFVLTMLVEYLNVSIRRTHEYFGLVIFIDKVTVGSVAIGVLVLSGWFFLDQNAVFVLEQSQMPVAKE